MAIELLRKNFYSKWGSSPLVVRAPGRINLLGEHTDYNEGFVLPGAIEQAVYVALAPNSTQTCALFSIDLNQEASFELNTLSPGHAWFNYVQGVVHGQQQANHQVGGFNMMITGDIPLGAGLSSSAALCCGVAKSISALFGTKISNLDIVKIAQHAEHHFAGVKCGIMDQFASVHGKQGHILKLDCRNNEYELVKFENSDLRLVLVNSMVKHALAESAYNKRREACETGVSLLAKRFAVKSLRDVSWEMLQATKSEMPNAVFVPCQYVVEEIARTEKAIEFIKNGQWTEFGNLMYATHEGLSVQYQVSCPETDFLVQTAQKSGFVVGARMMGGGFGGCTINLVKASRLDEFKSLIGTTYHTKFGLTPDVFEVTLSDGISIIN